MNFFFRPEVIIIDLTIPWDDRVDAARSEKLAKFSKLVATIKANEAFNVTYQSIEIGSYRQRLSDGSESAMKLLYNYITPKMSFEQFRCNLIDLVNYSSYEVSFDVVDTIRDEIQNPTRIRGIFSDPDLTLDESLTFKRPRIGLNLTFKEPRVPPLEFFQFS